VQLGVGRDHGRHVVGSDGGLAAPADLAQPRDGLGGGAPGGEPGRLGLQQPADDEQLVGLLHGGGVHEGALARAQVDPAVVLEPLQGLADRLARDAQGHRELVLHQVLAGAQLAADDHVEDRVVGALAQRHRARDAPCGGAGGLGHSGTPSGAGGRRAGERHPAGPVRTDRPTAHSIQNAEWDAP
jgi:hypothetical protein